ncbi:putative flagellar filament outer layer-like protein [Spirochaetota bacterium]|nr:putative flagellar filament outer layer-like protein [Spirochaetota bacterium]
MKRYLSIFTFFSECLSAKTRLNVRVACLIFVLALGMLVVPASAQDDATPEQQQPTTTTTTPAPDATSPQAVNRDGGVKFQQYLVDNFEDADLWFGGMWVDDGVIQVRKVFGAPEAVRAEDTTTSLYSLGAKVNFLRRSYSYASIEPPREIIIPGITQKLSVWVQGRGVPHKLFAVIRDFEGKTYRVPFGTLDFTGWKQLEALIPERIDQQNKLFATYYRRQGITFVAFYIEFDPDNTFGNFFTYFDKFEATTNIYLYEEQLRNDQLSDEERVDPIDNW